MRWLACLVVLVSGCDVVWRLDHIEDAGADTTEPWLAGYSHRKVVDLLPPNNGPLDAYPFAIVVPVDADLAAGARSDGRDLVLTNTDGTTVMAYELEKYDPTGKLVLWVTIPRLDGPKRLYLYYGGPPSTAVASATWTVDIAVVWHLTDPGMQEARDSTANAKHLEQIVVAQQPAIAAGIAGDARSFAGGTDMDTVGIGFQPHLGSFSYSLWARTTEVPTSGYEGLFYNGGVSMTDPGFDVERTAGDWRADLADGARNAGAQLSSVGSDLVGQWVLLAAVVDRDLHVHQAYVNGVMRGTTDITNLGAPDHNGRITLGSLDGGQFYIGLIDEVRIYSRALSAAWFATDYAILSDPTPYVTLGTEEDLP